MEWLSENRNASVLIVEDDPVATLLLERVFQKHRVRVDTTDNAETALELHQRNNYRLIISDWVLPGKTGVDLCAEVRKTTGDYVYFIVCTCRGQRNDRLHAFEAGVDDFIAKPVDREELEARLNVASRLIQNRELLQTKTIEFERLAGRLSDANRNLEIASRRFEEMFNGLPFPALHWIQLGSFASGIGTRAILSESRLKKRSAGQFGRFRASRFRHMVS